jgi:predicted PurR-regulated permease PerM
MARIPETAKDALSPEMLSSLSSNAQTLVSAQSQEQLKAAFSQMGQQGAALYGQLFQSIRDSLTSAMGEVFLVAVGIVAVAFVLNFFLKDKPVKRVAVEAQTAPLSIPENPAKMCPEKVRIDK